MNDLQKKNFIHSIVKYDHENSSIVLDQLAIEEPLEIVLKFTKNNQTIYKTIAITMRTPGNDLELTLGFLFSESIIDSYSDILSVDYRMSLENNEETQQTIVLEVNPDLMVRIQNLERHFYTNSSCGVCGKTSIDLTAQAAKYILKKHQKKISVSFIYSLPDKLNTHQSIFHLTGGIHAAALFDFDSNFVCLTEDIGRHNAVDKLIGKGLLSNDIPCQDHILVLSGRSSFELIQKAIISGIPIVVSVGAPSSLAVQLADSFGMTLIGFLRGNKLNVYTHSYRITQ